MEALMPSCWWFKRPARSSKTAAEIRADAQIHDKEVELTYLRQIVDIAKITSLEAGADVADVLRTSRRRTKAAMSAGERFHSDFGGSNRR